jgi:predicted regulator of amino acid metabolism with ACT domain
MPSSALVLRRLLEIGVEVTGAMKDANDIEMTT